MQPSHIRYLNRHEVDALKWDACIKEAPNGNPYALAAFLDIMAPGWCALVAGDYLAVMPLPVRKKFGIAYIFQPFLTPFLGIFSKAETNIETDIFLRCIPRHFKLWDFSLNPGNTTGYFQNSVIPRTNYMLSLGLDYPAIREAYHPHLKRSLQKAEKASLQFITGVQVQDIIAICKDQYPAFTKVGAGDFEAVATLCTKMKDNLVTYGVCDSCGDLLAGCIFLRFKHRLYYWLPGNKPEGRHCGASAFLLDRVIKANASSDLTLDFEGSDDPGVAQFYQRFGACAEYYQTLYVNKLPFPLSSLKKMPAYYRQLLNKKAK